MDNTAEKKKKLSASAVRSFIAIKLPEAVLSHIAALQHEVRAAGFRAKWVKPASIHLTLKFLGDVRQTDIAGITRVMESAALQAAPLTLGAKGIGVFPNIRRPKVIWTGLAGDTAELAGFQGLLETLLQGIGFPREHRRFKAHLTLGRIRERIHSKTVADVLEKFGKFEPPRFTADRITLYRSDLKPAGAIYTELFSTPLSGR